MPRQGCAMNHFIGRCAALIALVFALWAFVPRLQQPAATPLPAVDVTAAEITSFINALPRDAISDRPIRAADVGGYGVTVYGVFRPKSLPGDAILHQTRTSEIYYMLKGAGTLVTGGTL